MPPHRQVTKCLRDSADPITDFCSCAHCTLAVCEICGAYEGSLTTDCPGEQVDFERQKLVYTTLLDYDATRGWHQGVSAQLRSPRFEPRAKPASPKHAPIIKLDGSRVAGCLCGWRVPPGTAESDTAFSAHAAFVHGLSAYDALSLSLPTPGRTAVCELSADLAQKAVAWVAADRICDDHAASLSRIEDEADAHLRSGQEPNEQDRELLKKLEHAKISFQLACRRAEKRDEEFREAARQLARAG